MNVLLKGLLWVLLAADANFDNGRDDWPDDWQGGWRPLEEELDAGGDLHMSYTVTFDEERLHSSIRLAQPELPEYEVTSQANRILDSAEARTVEILRNRINGIGIKEAVVQAKEGRKFHIQLSGLSNEQRTTVERSIQLKGLLEFKLVHPQDDTMVNKLFADGRVPEGYVADGRAFRRSPDYETLAKDPEYFNRLSLFEVPDPRYAFMLERVVSETDGGVSFRPVFVQRTAAMDGSALLNTTAEVDPLRGVTITLKFTPEGTKAFANLTRENIGRGLAIIMDDTLYSTPRIYEEIQSGDAQISGRFSVAEGRALRNILNVGALPAPMKIIETHERENPLMRD